MEKILRKLARSSDWQLLYAKSSEINGINLFENINNFSKLQLRFLYWLSIYHSLYSDLYSHEPYITIDVIEDDIETDAYLYYRSVKKEEPNKIDKAAEKKQPVLGIPSLLRRKKR